MLLSGAVGIVMWLGMLTAPPVSVEPAQVDEMAAQTVQTLRTDDPEAGAQLDRAYGYAVFRRSAEDATATNAGGSGVAVDKTTGVRTYMRMGTAQPVPSADGDYRIVIVFATREDLDRFIAGDYRPDEMERKTEGVTVHVVPEQAGARADRKAALSGTRFWPTD